MTHDHDDIELAAIIATRRGVEDFIAATDPDALVTGVLVVVEMRYPTEPDDRPGTERIGLRYFAPNDGKGPGAAGAQAIGLATWVKKSLLHDQWDEREEEDES